MRLPIAIRFIHDALIPTPLYVQPIPRRTITRSQISHPSSRASNPPAEVTINNVNVESQVTVDNSQKQMFQELHSLPSPPSLLSLLAKITMRVVGAANLSLVVLKNLMGELLKRGKELWQDFLMTTNITAVRMRRQIF